MGVSKIIEEVMQTESKYIKQKLLVAYDDDNAIKELNVVEVERELKKSHRSYQVAGKPRVDKIFRLKSVFKITVLLEGQEKLKTLSTSTLADKVRYFKKFETAHQFIVDNLPNTKEYKSIFLTRQKT